MTQTYTNRNGIQIIAAIVDRLAKSEDFMSLKIKQVSPGRFDVTIGFVEE